MMKIKYLIYLAFTAIFYTQSSCQKWLEVQPEDKFTKEQMYSSAAGIQEVANGLYINLGHNNLYGATLTLTHLDNFAQRYEILGNSHSLYNYANLDYEQANVKGSISAIWTKMYANIANTNDFIKEISLVNAVISEAQKKQYLGEAIALRAFMHFDLLRMFGPAYDENSKTEESIPYYTTLATEIQPFETSENIVTKILSDLKEASIYLVSDPIRTQKGTENLNNMRFNYYAVKALEARVYQWIGDKENALMTAQEVITASEKFPWVTHTAITANGANPDRKFFSETIFNVFNDDLYQVQLNNFDFNLSVSQILATGAGNYVETIYEGNSSDYRFEYAWPIANGGVGYRTFVKYADITDKTALNRFTIPIIRLSEMYYIAAESSADPLKGLEYLNTVRRHRNILNNIQQPEILQDELTKEYLKEFYGEGQLWYYYKRKKMTQILSVSATNHKKEMSVSKYRFGIPDHENNGR